MKKILLFVGLLCFPVMVSADNDMDYVIIYDEQQDTSHINKIEDLGNNDAADTLSKSIIREDIEKMSFEMRSKKNQVYKEIYRFKYGF